LAVTAASASGGILAPIRLKTVVYPTISFIITIIIVVDICAIVNATLVAAAAVDGECKKLSQLMSSEQPVCRTESVICLPTSTTTTATATSTATIIICTCTLQHMT
jgi:hypothetical protein